MVVKITNTRGCRRGHWQQACTIPALIERQDLQGRKQMFARTLIVAGGLALALAGVVAAQPVVTGTVTRIDQPASVIVLQDGRIVRAPGATVRMHGHPMATAGIKPVAPGAMQNAQGGAE